ncbi:hypothetical protein F8M41_005759 [Gigaspora margarita]|uniref:CRIB domain-containing protein n=1 Tax=Gigaspora margarita TaxID=4874 RepID=A0A8H3X9K3_GIGMA|nr:hypothetical protein F8M41_005759 [Gigaspora margarita]
MGNCLASPNQRPRNIGISSQSLNSIPKRNFFHDNEHNNTKKSKTFKRKKIHKNLIGLPSNFQHTGHIGISELRSGKVDAEKVKTQMAEVAAALRLEINPVSESIDTQNNQIPISNQVQDSFSFTSNSPSQFNVKKNKRHQVYQSHTNKLPSHHYNFIAKSSGSRSDGRSRCCFEIACMEI